MNPTPFSRFLAFSDTDFNLGNAPYAVSRTLNRAARIMSTGNGGQILLLQEMADLVQRNLPEGISLKDLGEHCLKGMELSQIPVVF